MRTLRYGAILLFFITLWGCSKGNDKNTILDSTGKHPANWVSNHAGFFRSLPGAIDDPTVAKSSACSECHGSDLKGGITKVSCFSQGYAAMSCHFHPAGYRNSNSHGAVAKSTPTFSSGLDSCRGCHGGQYTGGTLSVVSCSSAASLADPAFACHGSGAPHAKNWVTSATSSHADTNPSNAAACYQCHAGGNLLTLLPAPPPQPKGTPPGCFNNTLCHAGLHPTGWINPVVHGAAAKSQPGADKGFNNCQTCHGADFRGGTTGVSCFSANSPNGSCHLRNGSPVNAPHAALPWRAASPSPSHTSVVDDAQGLNAAVCAQCHLRGANLRTAILTSYASGTPGCFNSTLCHGTMGHPTGWADPAQHGATAKSNLTFCQTCHSNNPNGGPGSNPRFNVVLGRLTAGCETCHMINTAHPPVVQLPAAFGITSPDPLGTPWFRHRTATNFDACNRCHGATLGGVAEGGVGPRCQNCHVAASPLTTINNPDPCTSCHSQPPSGTVYPNINAAHSNHLTVNVATGALCNECHLGFGSGTLLHFTKASLQPTPQVASMAFGTLSKTGGLVPAYTSATQQCTNTYCHGNAMPGGDTTGTNRSPVWTAATYPPVLSAAFCGKCHGFPPSTASGHPAVTVPAGFPGSVSIGTTCSCHSNINPSGNSYANIFVSKALHINGTLETPSSGHASTYPGATHKNDILFLDINPCGACHNITASTGVYPAATAGTPPNCAGCHSKSWGTSFNCSDCHGNDATGRPTGSAFPDRNGDHGTHSAIMANCDYCHFGGGTGAATHGHQGRVLKTVRDVKIAKNPVRYTVADTIVINQNATTGSVSCSGSCHMGSITRNHGDTW